MAKSPIASLIAAVNEAQSVLLESRLAALGVGYASFQLLSAVYASGGDATQSEVGRRLGVAPATLSEAVRNHVERGWLDQRTASQDRRVRRLALTPRGREIMAGVLAEVASVDEAMLAGIPSNRLREVAEALSSIVANLERERERRSRAV